MKIAAGSKYNYYKKKRPSEIFGLKMKKFTETRQIVVR